MQQFNAGFICQIYQYHMGASINNLGHAKHSLQQVIMAYNNIHHFACNEDLIEENRKPDSLSQI